MSNFPPTDEQRAIHDLFRTGQPIRIRAGAGTGKTTTCTQLADIIGQQNRIGLYIAFNKSIATEAARKFPNYITCSTAHSLAYRGIGNTRHAPLLNKMRNTARVPIRITEQKLGVLNFATSAGETGGGALTAYSVTRHALDTVDRFCKTADTEILPRHVARIPGLDDPDVHHALVDFVLPVARKAWTDIKDPAGTAVAFGHSHYLKLWALEHPVIGQPGGVLFLDEAQDTSPVLAGVIAEQTHLQVVAVGDAAQSIYGFTGAVNAMDTLLPDAAEGRLTQSWRFGDTVADAANTLLDRLRDDMRLTGNPYRTSIVDPTTPGDTILCRTNGTAIEYVMEAQDNGKSVHLMGDNSYAVRFCDDAEKLMRGRKGSLPDLVAFKDWAEVCEHAKDSADSADWKVLVSLIEKHGVPAVRAALDGTVTEQHADIIVATAHKSKGREWGTVQLADDLADKIEQAQQSVDYAVNWNAGREALTQAEREWRSKRKHDRPSDALRKAERNLRDELMLGYVAVTRAQDVLNPGRILRPAAVPVPA